MLYQDDGDEPSNPFWFIWHETLIGVTNLTFLEKNDNCKQLISEINRNINRTVFSYRAFNTA